MYYFGYYIQFLLYFIYINISYQTIEQLSILYLLPIHFLRRTQRGEL